MATATATSLCSKIASIFESGFLLRLAVAVTAISLVLCLF